MDGRHLDPVTGCSIVSPGCTNCYAMKLAGTRLKHTPSRRGLTRDSKAGPVWTGEVRLNEDWLDQPLRWRRPRKIFVCAHGDLFAENVPDEGTRRDSIWSDGEISAFLAVAPEYMRRALMLALWTGQRQGDLLRMTWRAYDGTHIRLRQSKTSRPVRIKVSEELKVILGRAKKENDQRAVPAATILTNASGLPWKTGFKSQWRKTMAVAKVMGLTFHDLRGTFCTLANRNGASFKEIAEASGHEEKEAERIIRAHYLAGDSVIEKLEAGTSL